MSTDKIPPSHIPDDEDDFLVMLGAMAEASFDAYVRKQLRAWRERRKTETGRFNQADVAELLKQYLPESRHDSLTQSYISKIESGESPLDLDLLWALARVYGLSVRTLIGPLPEDAQRIASALDDPRVREFVELLQTGKLDRHARSALVMLRSMLEEINAQPDDHED